jgi:oxamate amidohydrolase
MALKDGRPHLLYGTQGADGQPQTLVTLLSRVIDHGFDPVAALAAPRFLLGRTFSDSRDSLKIEQSVGAGVLDELAARGHEISLLEPHSPISGQVGLIRIGDTMIDGPMIRAVTESRSVCDGKRLAVPEDPRRL